MNNFDKIVACCSDLLFNFEDAKETADYANSRLSIEGQKKFCFGYFPNNKNLPLLQTAVGEETLSSLGLIYDKNLQDGLNTISRHATLEHHNLIMPYRDVYGNIIALVGRTLIGEQERGILNIPKYKNTEFKKGLHLFGLYEAKYSIIKNNLVYIVEGQFDCITAHDKGLTNVVALGSSNMTFEQLALISRYTNNIILLLDNDQAGKLGAKKIEMNYSKYINIKIAVVPKGFKDLDEYLKTYSIDEISFVLKK